MHVESKSCNQKLEKVEQNYLISNKVGLPVRLHDHAKFSKQFGLAFHEFHLSFGEVFSETLLPFASQVSKSSEYSVHLPDYVSHNAIIDPLSNDPDLLELSEKVISKAVKFAQVLSDRSGAPCNIVGSFPYSSDLPEEFIKKLYSRLMTFEVEGVEILPQWLPAVGWYFGGACGIDTFNSELFVSLVEQYNLKHCLDICHLILSANASRISWVEWYDRLLPSAKHIHLADAKGISEEGLPLLAGDILGQKLHGTKGLPIILEVWQGHLNDGEKFFNDLKTIAQKEVLE